MTTFVPTTWAWVGQPAAWWGATGLSSGWTIVGAPGTNPENGSTIPGAGDTAEIPVNAEVAIAQAGTANDLLGVDNMTILNSGQILIDAGSTTTGHATWLINSQFAGDTVALSYDTSNTGTGSQPGQVLMTDNANNTIDLNFGASNAILLNANNTILGAGTITGNGGPELINGQDGNGVQAFIAATGVNALNVSIQFITNDGVMESINPYGHQTLGGLVINGNVDQTRSVAFTDVPTGAPTGIIKADGAGTHVDLVNGEVSGGTVEGVNDGYVQVVGDFNFDGSQNDGNGNLAPVTLAGDVRIVDSISRVKGTIDVTGTLGLDTPATGKTNGSEILLDGTTTFTGPGVVRLGDLPSERNAIASDGSTQTLNNQTTIAGAGAIGGGIFVVNTGTINADGANDLALTGLGFTNSGGLLEDTNTGGLVLRATINNQSGTIAANGAGAGAGAGVYLEPAGKIQGGTLATSGGGIIHAQGGSIDGATFGPVTLSGTLQVDSNQGLNLGGELDNSGTVDVSDAGTTNTGIYITGATTLKGSGSIVFSDVANVHNFIQDNGSAQTLDNVDNTISGAGQIRGQLAFTNEANGVLLADSTAGNSLVIVTSSFTNSGTLRATNGAAIAVQVDGNHSFTNLTADPLHPGGDVLTGGTYDVVDPAGGGGSQIVFYNPGVLPITTLDADVVLSGASSSLSTVFDQFTPQVSLQTSLVDIGAAGALNLFYGSNSETAANFSDSHAVEVAGAINLNGANFTAAQITLDATGSVAGSGILTASGGSIVDNGVITADPVYGPLATSLDVVGNVTGSGALDITQNATLELAASSTVGAGNAVQFVAASGSPGEELKIDATTVNNTTIAATISGYALGDKIDLTQIAADHATIDASNELHVFSGSTEVASLQLSASNSGETFAVKGDGGVGSLISIAQAPTLTPVEDETLEATGPTGAAATFAATATDALDGTDPVVFQEGSKVVHSGDIFALGTHTITASATDSGGGTSSETFTIKVQDTTPPTLTPPANQTDEATGASGAAVTFSATATDLVDGTDPVVFTEGNTAVHSGDTFGIGTHTISASATDAAGNSVSKQFTIKVQDTTPPTLTPVANQTVKATGANGAAVTFSATATDLVDGTDPVVFSEGNTVVHSGDTFAIGGHTITATATDTHGNTGSETFTVTVSNSFIVSSGQTLTVSAGKTSGGGLVLSGGTINVLSGGTAIDTTINKGGTDRVSGVDINATLSGGTEIVSRTGVASGTTVVGGGSQTDLGKTVATVLKGGTEIVSSGGTASNTVISSGGSLVVLSRGLADPATVYSGGSETISKGGTDLGAHISGGIQIDSGLASGAVLLAGSQVVASGGTAVGTSVSGGGTEIVSSGGTTSNTLLASGQETVLRGGHASGAIITSGGYELVSSGGTAVATRISGGTLEVASGGSASGVVFSSGGMLQVDSGGHLSGAISGFHLGDEIDLRGLAYSPGSSTLSWTQKSSGAHASGTLTVKEGTHSTTLTLVGSYTSGNFTVAPDGHGGTLITDPPVTGGESVATGAGIGSSMADIAAASSVSVISGGYELGVGEGTTADTHSGGDTAGVFFSGGGMVALDALLSQFTAVISGFELDLQSLGFDASSSAMPWMQQTSGGYGSGPASLNGGGHVFSLALLDQYAANFSAGADSHDGPLITDPAASSPLAPPPLVVPHS